MLILWMCVWGCVATMRQGPVNLSVIRFLTAGTYFLAALHKLNSNFFNPDISCAHHAFRGIASHWSEIDWSLIPIDSLPHLIIVTEVLIGALILRRSLWVWPLGFVVHAPLTVTLAPAFGAVMFAGYAGGLSARQWSALHRIWRGHWFKLVGIGLLALGLEIVVQSKASMGLPWVQVGLGAMLAASAFMLMRQRYRGASTRGHPLIRRSFGWVGLAYSRLNPLRGHSVPTRPPCSVTFESTGPATIATYSRSL